MMRVLIADDQELVRIGFRVILNAEPDIEVVGEAGDGREAIEAAAALRPDVVLMDIRMPNLDGIEATRRIAAGRASPRVLILTTFDLDEYVDEALRADASGFLLKTRAPTSSSTLFASSPAATRCSRPRSRAGWLLMPDEKQQKARLHPLLPGRTPAGSSSLTSASLYDRAARSRSSAAAHVSSGIAVRPCCSRAFGPSSEA